MDPLQAAPTETNDNSEAIPEYTQYSVQGVSPMTSLQTNRYNKTAEWVFNSLRQLGIVLSSRGNSVVFSELTIEAGLFNFSSGQEWEPFTYLSSKLACLIQLKQTRLSATTLEGADSPRGTALLFSGLWT